MNTEKNASKEVEQLKELVFQKERLLLISRAGLAAALVDRFGEEAEEAIKDFVKDGARDWAASGGKVDRQANRRNDIEGLMNFLWEPLRQEGFEFTYTQNEQGYQLKVTRCPVAEIAKAHKLEKWGFIFHCMSDEAIAEGYNSEIGFVRTKTIMEGEQYCNHCYYYRK